MNPSRRNLLISAGGAGLALLGAGAAFAATRTPHRAFAPWQVSPADDVRLHAFRHAILAPNPHNRQPWLITLVGKDEALIHCDLERRLPVTDPFDRQITIGFGCFLELARIAAAERGVSLAIGEFPEGMPEASGRLDGRPIAHLKFAGEAHADPLFSAIAIRRSVKEPFDTSRPVPSAAIETLAASGSARARVGGTDDMALVQDLRALTWTAWMVEANTHAAFKESVDLMRIGKAEIEANPDGIALGGPLLEAMALMGLLSREQMLNPASAAFRAGIDKYRPIIATAMGYGWIVSRANARTDQLEAGRVYVRMNLQAALAGLSMHPVSQALQEFPEMAKVRERSQPPAVACRRRDAADASAAGLRCAGDAIGTLAARRPDQNRLTIPTRPNRITRVRESDHAERPDMPTRDTLPANDSLAFRVMNEIGIISQLGATLFERVMPDGMTLAQFTVLNRFVRIEGSSSPLELARAFQVTKGTMSSTLQRLEAHGWIMVRPDPADGRAKRVTITASGRRARAEALQALEPVTAELETMFGGRLGDALPFLAELRAYLDRRRDEPDCAA